MDLTLQTSTSDVVTWAAVVSRTPNRKPEPKKGFQEEKKVQPLKPERSNPRQEEEKEKPWKPEDPSVDPGREARLIQKMKFSMRKTERSDLYTIFYKRLKSFEVLEHFRLVRGTETKLQKVIYGLGKIEIDVDSRIQLAIALSMKRECNWISEIQVFDPALSATECSVIESLGCTVLYVNEYARRVALKPTLFFMPFCDYSLYANLLEVNRRNHRLSNIALLAPSFQNFEETSQPKGNKYDLAGKLIIAARRITREFPIEAKLSDGCYSGGFLHFSWHFFVLV